MMKSVVVIPVYNHQHAIAGVVAAVLQHGLPCILVDDGSAPACAAILDALATQTPDSVYVVRSAQNYGKGHAVVAGFHEAVRRGYSHALQIDADGQHHLADIPRFLDLAVQYPQALIAGCPRYDDSVPKGRLYGRYLTHVWVWINTLSFKIRDSMCGFRLYPLAAVMMLLQKKSLATRMDFDTDIIVRLAWDNVTIINVPTAVAYPVDGVSHFRLFRDNVRITWLHTRLFFGMLRRLPPLLRTKYRQRHWAKRPEVTFITGMRLLLWLFKVGGPRLFNVILYPVLFGYLLTQPSARAASRQYLQRIHALDNNVKVSVLRHFAAFAHSMRDKMLLYSGRYDLTRLSTLGAEAMNEAIASKQGGLLICAHFGNLELCRVLAQKRDGLKLTVLVHTHHARAFNQLLQELDPDCALNVLQVTEFSAAMAVMLLAKMDQGEFIVIAGDRIPVALKPRVVSVPFLGDNAPFPIGPYVLAHALQCPTFLLFSLPTATGVELHIEPFRDSIQWTRATREQVLIALATDYAARLAHYCLQNPWQWFNFYPFWQPVDTRL